MVNHVYFRVYNIYLRVSYHWLKCGQPWFITVNHGRPWLAMVQCCRVYNIYLRVSYYWVKCGQPWFIIVNHGQPWLAMVQRCIVTKIVLIWKSVMVNHGPTSYCEKDCLNPSGSNIKIWKVLSQSLGFINPRVQKFLGYNIIHMVYNSNPKV